MMLSSVSSTQSRPFFPQSQKSCSFSSRHVINTIWRDNKSRRRRCSNSWYRSVRDPGMILRPKRTSFNGLTLSAMAYSCVKYFHNVEYSRGHARTCFTSTFPVASPMAPLVLRAPSSLVLAAQFVPSNIPQRSEEWFALRKNRLTASTFSTALGFWKGNRRPELWQQKVFPPDDEPLAAAARAAMDWGVLNETAAIERYKIITGHDVSSLGFAIHAGDKFGWLGTSPDGLLGCCPGGGVLEVKCPYNKGKPEVALPWSTIPFYYMPQIQGQMEILDREWVDLFCWTQKGSKIFRVCRDRAYWELICGILQEFWWENVVPAKEALLLGREEDAKSYKPESKHRQTGLVVFKSLKLAAEAKLVCREIAGHVEFYS